MSKASHYPTLNIHVEAFGTSEMGYYKRLSHVREQENMGHTFMAYTCTGNHWKYRTGYNTIQYRKSLV